MDAQETPSTLEYTLACQGDVVVATLVGAFRDAKDMVDKCLGEILITNCTYCVLFARDMKSVEANSFRDLVHFQEELRKHFGGHFKVCSLNPGLRAMLLRQGIVRPHELTNGLRETLQNLLKEIHRP